MTRGEILGEQIQYLGSDVYVRLTFPYLLPEDIPVENKSTPEQYYFKVKFDYSTSIYDTYIDDIKIDVYWIKDNYRIKLDNIKKYYKNTLIEYDTFSEIPETHKKLTTSGPHPVFYFILENKSIVNDKYIYQKLLFTINIEYHYNKEKRNFKTAYFLYPKVLEKKYLESLKLKKYKPIKINLSVGPSYSYISKDEKVQGNYMGLDFTWLPFYSSKYSYIGLLWCTIGLNKSLNDRPINMMPYIEAGFSLGLNIGVGITADIYRDEPTTYTPTMFFGLPIPITYINEPFLLIQPYWRPRFGPEMYNYELGILLKYRYPGLGIYFD